MLLALPICIWGTFLGWQYRHDKCVQNNPYYLALDWWLMSISAFNICFMTFVMLLLCFRVSGAVRRWFIWPMHVLNVLGNVGGLFLIVRVSCHPVFG